MSRFTGIRYVLKTIIWIVRGTPLMLQILVIFYVPGILLFGVPISTRFNAVIIGFVINYACYFSEIFRGGIESISRSQYEAGQVLGMTKTQIFFRVILLQVIKRITAPMSNEIITLVKDTALARIIVVTEILFEAGNLASKGMVWPMFFTGIYYLVFVGMLTLMFGYAEKRLSYFRA
jgi:polar amino acid transport system permease protein